MSHVHAQFNQQDGAVTTIDDESGVANRLHALPDELPKVGSFATGLANAEPRLWSGEQLVGARRSRIVSGALRDELPRVGSFATGLANAEPRLWSGEQLVGDRLTRRQ
jgi:hypothetical protein